MNKPPFPLQQKRTGEFADERCARFNTEKQTVEDGVERVNDSTHK